jgi:hypothetical protein
MNRIYIWPRTQNWSLTGNPSLSYTCNKLFTILCSRILSSSLFSYWHVTCTKWDSSDPYCLWMLDANYVGFKSGIEVALFAVWLRDSLYDAQILSCSREMRLYFIYAICQVQYPPRCTDLIRSKNRSFLQTKPPVLRRRCSTDLARSPDIYLFILWFKHGGGWVTVVARRDTEL